jgi:hypothetical protein
MDTSEASACAKFEETLKTQLDINVDAERLVAEMAQKCH